MEKKTSQNASAPDAPPPPPPRTPLRDALVALSLSNLLFLYPWSETLPGALPEGLLYAAASYPARVQYLMLVLNVLLWASLFYAAARLLRRWQRPVPWALAVAALLALSALALNALRRQLPSLSLAALLAWVGAPLLALTLAALLALALWLLWRVPGRTIGALYAALLALSPFALLTCGQSLATWAGYRARAARLGPSSLAPSERAFGGARDGPVRAGPAARRVVWLLFDELSYNLAFEARPAGVELPAFDALAAASLHATGAYPPARLTTLSVPAYLTGRRVRRARVEGPSRLRLDFEDGSSQSWGEGPTLFGRLGERGEASGVVGWYHPYCRMFARELAWCRGYNFTELWLWQEHVTAPKALLRQVQSVLWTAPGVRRLLGNAPAQLRDRIALWRTFEQDALEAVGKDELAFVLVHAPVPHPPGIYDRAHERLAARRGLSYLDNLELADRFLGKVLARLDAPGEAATTALIVTSDHWWRTGLWRARPGWSDEEEALLAAGSDRRVPFLVHLPGQRAPLRYDPRFETRAIYELTLALLKGTLRSAGEVGRWLDANRARFAVRPAWLSDAKGR